MKKLLVTLVAAVTLLFSGCEWSETTITNTATTAGNIAMLTWFSIQNPDQTVKDILKDVVANITTATVQVAEGKTYLDSFLPQVQELANKNEKLTSNQKMLISAGAVVILNGIDTFLDSNEKVKTDAALVNKVVSAFGKGCLSVLNLSSDSKEIKRARAVNGIVTGKTVSCSAGK